MSSTSVAAGVAAVLVVSLSWQAADRGAQWRADLDVFSRTLKSDQYDFSRRNDAVAFDAEVAALKRDAAALSDADITLRLMKLVAAAHDGHSRVNLPLFAPFRRLPLTVEWYRDGLAVTASAQEYREALGLRVTRMGGLSPEQVLQAAAPYIAHENESSLRAESPGYLTTVELLQTIGAADRTGSVALTLERPDGTALELVVAPGSPLHWSLVDAYAARNIPATVARRHPDQRYYWFEYLPEPRAMYVQYNTCRNDPRRRFADFARDLFATAARAPVERWILDLRANSGGSDRVIRPLTDGLAHAAARPPVFVLIGGATFSAAIEAAMDFKATLHATLVGEPTGGRPNIFGNPKTVTLPNSQLRVQYSTSFARRASGADPPAVEPDVRVVPALADLLAGRDPVLDAALQFRR